MRRILLALSVLLLVACGSGPAQREAPPVPTDWPKARLPDDVVPLAYRLDLTIVPDRSGFSGRTEIDVELERPLSGFWMHGRGLRVSELLVRPEAGEPVPGVYTEVGEDGVAWVGLDRELGA